MFRYERITVLGVHNLTFYGGAYNNICLSWTDMRFEIRKSSKKINFNGLAVSKKRLGTDL